MFARIRDLVFGYDICFLHAGNQFSDYVDSLANHLSHDNYRCYIERVEGLDFDDKTIGNAINSSSLLVVLATEEGIHSEFIEKTIDVFINKRKTVIAIDTGFLKDSQWYYLLKNQRKITEKASFLENLKPSNSVFDVIINAATFRIKNKILKQSNLVSAVLVVVSIFFMLGASYYIYYLSDQLKTNWALVDASQQTVTVEQKNARQAIEEAKKQQNDAKTQSKLAFATKMAVASNNMYVTDPTRAIRFAEKGYRDLDTQEYNPPLSIISSMLNSFYQTYLLKYTFYEKNIEFKTSVNDFQEIAGIEKLLVANNDGKIRIVNKEGNIEAVFDAHKHKVNKVTYSGANQFILTTSDDNTANLLTINGELIKTLPGHQDAITFGMISPNGDRLFTITDDSIRLWDNQGNAVAALGEGDEIINYAAFSPVENNLAAAIGSTIKLLDFKGNIRDSFAGHTDEIIKLSYSVNGSRIVSASYDSTAIIWSKSGQLIKKLEGHSGIVNDARFSPDRKMIVTVSDDQSAKLWSWEGQFIRTMAGHSDAVIKVAFSPNSLYILTISLDNTIKVWDNRGNHLQTLKAHQANITEARFSSDSKTITSSSRDGTIKTWPVAPELIVSMDLHAQGVKEVLLDPDEKNIWTVSGRGLLRLWNTSGKLKNANFIENTVVNQIFSIGKGEFMGVFDGKLKKMNASGKFTRQWNKLGAENSHAAISGQGEVAALSINNVLKVLPNPKDTIVFFNDSTLVVNGFIYGHDEKLILATSKGLGVMTEGAKLDLMAFTGQNVNKLLPARGGNQYMIFLENGQLILADDQFKPKQQFSNDFGNITAAVDDFKSEIIFAGTADGKLLVFHQAGQLIADIKLHQAQINRLSLFSDGKRLLTAADDNSAKICYTVSGIAEWLKTSGTADFED